MEVNVQNSEIKKLANQLMGYSSELEEEIGKIRNIIESIPTSWSGGDSEKYVEVLQSKYILGLEELKKIVDEYAVNLNNIPDYYEILDQAYSTKHIEV